MAMKIKDDISGKTEKNLYILMPLLTLHKPIEGELFLVVFDELT